MSILAALGASPSSFTVPLMLATVAGSIGVAGAAAVAAALGVAAGSVPSFLPHPARRTRPNEATKPQTDIEVFLVIFFLYLSDMFSAQTNCKSIPAHREQHCWSISYWATSCQMRHLNG